MPPLARHLASQSVHLTIHPPPRSLSDSKRVLSVLQKYGEVVTFRNLKYDQTNTHPTASRNTIAVFDSPQAAKSAVASSPLTVASPSPAPSSLHPSPTSTSASSSSVSLTCTLQPSRHNHLSALHRNPCYGAFAVEKDSYQALDLRKTGVPVAELADVPVRWKPVMNWRGHSSPSNPSQVTGGGAQAGEGGKGKGNRTRRMRRGMGGVSLQEMYGSGFEMQSGSDSGPGGRIRDE